MSDTKMKLYCGDLKGDTVNTTCSFGQVTFDAHGCAEVEATEEDVAKLTALGWTGSPPAPQLTPEEQVKADMPREMVLLHAPDLKGEKVSTSFGTVHFDENGMAEWNASADDLVKLHALRWVLEPQPTMENTARTLAHEPLRGPTIEEYVSAGYLPEEYPPQGYEKRASAGLTAFESGGKVPWDERLVQARREQVTRERAEQAARDAAQLKANAAQSEIAARNVVAEPEPVTPPITVVETPAPTPVAEDPVPAPSAKQQAKAEAKAKAK